MINFEAVDFSERRSDVINFDPVDFSERRSEEVINFV